MEVPATRHAGAVARLSGELRTRAVALRGPAADLVVELRGRGPGMGLNAEAPGRLRTAEAASQLVNALAEREGVALFETLATADLASSGAALKASLATAEGNAAALRAVSWALLDSARDLPDSFGSRGRGIQDTLAEAAGREEYAIPLAPRLRAAQGEVEALFAEFSRRGTPASSRTTPSPSATHRAPQPVPNGGSNGVAPGTDSSAASGPSAEELCRHHGRSQVRGDQLPAGLPAAELWRGLRVHRFFGGDRERPLVVSAGLLDLIHADPNCRLDEAAGRLTLFGVSLELDLAPTAPSA